MGQPGHLAGLILKTNPKPFLTAEWRHLAMLNFPIDRAVLEPRVPAGTTLDTYQGQAYVSVVGFLFLKTKLLGVPVPFHQDFEELNLRFYVRRLAGDEWRRGVVFIQEIVPKAAIAAVARLAYNENYIALPMRHRLTPPAAPAPDTVSYEWEFQHRWHGLHLRTTGDPQWPRPGSLDEFITEHYWGYARQQDGGCVEYRVEHPPWRVWRAAEASLDADVAALYGEAFAPALRAAPSSAFLAEGSPVTVFHGQRI